MSSDSWTEIRDSAFSKNKERKEREREKKKSKIHP